MDIIVNLTQDEILNRPNDMDLGEYTRNKYWQERRNQEGPPRDDEHFMMEINPDAKYQAIDIRSLVKGAYFLRASFNGSMVTKKIMKI